MFEDFERERLIRQRLVATVRSGDTAGAQALQQQIAAIEARLASVTYRPGSGKE